MKNVKAHIAVLCTNLFFAVNYSLVKYVSPAVVGPFGLNVLRAGLSLLLFWLVWPFERKQAGIRRKDLGRFALCGLMGITLNQMLFIKGLTLTSTIHASLLTLATPLLVSFFALWVLKERFTRYKALGLASGIGGAALLILQKQPGVQAADYLYGDLLILLNAIVYAVYFILVKPLMANYSPMHVVRWVFSFGFLFILPFGWPETAAIRWQAFEWTHMAAIAAIVVPGTFLAYYFNVYAIGKLGAAVSGTYIYTQPVFAVLIAILWLGEALTLPRILAALLIFLGVYLVSMHPKGSPNS